MALGGRFLVNLTRTPPLTQGGDNSTPSALVVLAGGGVLAFPDVSDALTVVVLGAGTVGTSLDVDESLSLMLESLTTSESSEDCFLVKSNRSGGLLVGLTHFSFYVIIPMYSPM